MSTANASEAQRAIYDEIAKGSGNLVVQARAGAGKTTTIMGALKSVPSGLTIALFAFNKSIAIELGARAPRGVEVKTLHAHGFAACRRAFNITKDNIDNDKTKKLCITMFGEPVENHPIRGRYEAIADLVTKAKDTLVRRGDLDALDALVDAFEIDCPSDGRDRDDFIEVAMAVLERSAEVTTMIDFSDMCWLPVVLRLRVWAFDRVFVDETQDLSPTQIELLLMCVKRGGRICAVGDDRQAIYAFRGADVNTIPNLISRLNAKVLPLSVTYRCCRSVAALAATEVPDFTPADHAPEGAVLASNAETMLRDAAPGDMVISRANAPLLGFCLKLLRSGKRATVKGRDIGGGIIKAIERSKARSVPRLIEWAKAQHSREVARLKKAERPTDVADDRLECILALCEDAKGVSDVVERANSLFSADGANDSNTIVLGTTHKLKGLEAERVWMLADTYKRNRGGEEANCWYVAVTRAKRELHLVRDKVAETADGKAAAA